MTQTKTTYKKTGVSWIHEIPKGWEGTKIKHLFELYNSNSVSDKSKYLDDEYSYSYIATKDINLDTSKIDYLNGIYITKSNNQFKIAKASSVLLCIEGANVGKKICFVKKDVCFVNKLCVIKGKSEKIIDWYYFSSNIFKKQSFGCVSGIIGGVSISILKNFKIPLPTN